jgi:DNA invertase Pin-like site-specific DNA recombinase
VKLSLVNARSSVYTLGMTGTEENGLRAVAYLRCSTQEQANDGMSLDAQEARIRAWAEAVGAEVVEVVSDAGVSGTKALTDRPGGSRIAALLDARNPKIDAVVVLRLDRLGRDAAETLGLLKRFRTSKVGLVSVADRLDLGTPQGRAMAGMAAVFSELEHGLIAQRTSDALSELRRQGRTYGTTPFGWDATDGKLTRNRAEQKVLDRARQLRAEGLGYAKVAAQLNAEGLAPKRAEAWSAMSVRSVLRTAEKIEAAA